MNLATAVQPQKKESDVQSISEFTYHWATTLDRLDRRLHAFRNPMDIGAYSYLKHRIETVPGGGYQVTIDFTENPNYTPSKPYHIRKSDERRRQMRLVKDD